MFSEGKDIIGFFSQATEQEIRSAYRRLAKEFHPDSTRSTSGTDAQVVQRHDTLSFLLFIHGVGSDRTPLFLQFKDVNEAYKVLSDPEKREEYDKSLRVRPHQMNLESMADVST